ncbi:hypothetical protein K239x_44020 [Planctomycetes bacterium K23_9]|uniref:Uncharacterized protein n=1 Tax=Stieleria marina TaxID=1930275 RepID=A0A517NZ36_9BACT|nr:hypothetical protein K239x_44020 [Planctomycetes bacterium K23_9]
MYLQKRKLRCRKCGVNLDRVRRTFFERMLFARAAFGCPWCKRRRRVFFSIPRESKIEYGAAVPVNRQLTIRKDQKHAQPSQPTPSAPETDSPETPSQIPRETVGH